MRTTSHHGTECDWFLKLLERLETPAITPAAARAERTITPEDTLRAAEEVPDERQADYQRWMSSRLAGRPSEGAESKARRRRCSNGVTGVNLRWFVVALLLALVMVLLLAGILALR